ncbi:MAG: DUF4258 domain-containing protein [Candidatus Eremiobacteraeota bacterium]|nr:DUF4258 domain-containing protein [Candidatus Eremiobacteraeota bacterium]
MEDSTFFETIKAHFAEQNFYLTAHARKEAETDTLTIIEIWEALISGEMIEDYPDDPRGHSCFSLDPQKAAEQFIYAAVSKEEKPV